MLRVTGPVTRSMSAWRGDATKCMPKRSMSYTGPARPVISISQPLHEPASTSRIASARPRSCLTRRSSSRPISAASESAGPSGSVAIPTFQILENSSI